MPDQSLFSLLRSQVSNLIIDMNGMFLILLEFLSCERMISCYPGVIDRHTLAVRKVMYGFGCFSGWDCYCSSFITPYLVINLLLNLLMTIINVGRSTEVSMISWFKDAAFNGILFWMFYLIQFYKRNGFSVFFNNSKTL